MSGFSLFDLFREDASTQLAVLNDGLLSLERDPAGTALIEPLMRAAHSIKGAARIVNLAPVVEVAHAMEDVLVAAQRGQEKLGAARIDQLLRATDLLAAAAALDGDSIAGWCEAHRDAVASITAELHAPAPAGAAAGAMPATAPSTSAPRSAGLEAPGPAAAGAAATESRASAAAASVAASEEPSGNPGSAVPVGPVVPAVSVDPFGAAPVAEAPSARMPPQEAPAAPAPGGFSSARGSEAVRVAADRLERIMQLAGEIMVAGRQMDSMRQDVLGIRRTLGDAEDAIGALRQATSREADQARDALAMAVGAAQLDVRSHLEAVETLTRRTEELSASLYNAALGSRLRPFGDIAGGFPRMVRDIARQLGKRVRLEIQGEQVAVDRELLARIEAPLSHLLRNALDHGVEPPEAREAAGKSPEARILLEARHHAGRLMIRVVDDGRGIDVEAVRRRAVERGLAPADLAAGLGEREVLEFLFLPAFSTATQVSEISGRGVGLDIVQTMAHEVGGSARVETRAGEGSTFTLVLPVAVSVLRAAIAEIAGEPFAFPLARLSRVVRFSIEELSTVQGREQILLEGRSIGLVSAAELLELAPARDAAGSRQDRFAIVLEDDGARFGLVVDQLLGEEDLVVRTLDPRLGKVPHVLAGAMLERGDPCLILDVEDLVASLRQLLLEGRRIGMSRADAGDRSKRRRILVVDDSATVREVERQLLVREGYVVETAVDGVDGWNSLSVGQFDLLVTDVDMPRLNGIELVRRVRADDRLRRLPVVIVSYKDREEDRLRGLEVGADAYLTKGSFQDETFASTIRDLVGGAEA
ncbi:MAG TPA: hybrid sensor histidine kinase/response regulator [Phycisphaerales bacterium]|nr:hybrid sensor histidine kinase/response regulator [Phycisphaerales bacterium]HMP38238.1 hybrid sensor histidine kinase/response regulator [Phycisphaerales bacterium]